MRIFRVVRPRKRKRKRLELGNQQAVRAWHLWIVLVLVVAGTFLNPQLWNGNGATGKEVGRAFRFQLVRLNPQQLAAGLESTTKTISINSFLASRQSPLAGLGPVFLDAERETGVAAELIAAITLVESSCATDGSLSRTNHNAWGMKGPQPQLGMPAQNGFCFWPDWPSAIHGAARFILHYWGPAQTANELKGYACGSGSWAGSVEGARQTMI